MQFSIPDEVLGIIKKFEREGYEIYLVGGAVRDLLTGKKVDDWDFTTSATPEEILKIFPDGFYNNVFGTVGIPSEAFEPHEITTFRREFGYSDKRRPDKVLWGKSLKEDLSRRDFTINAIALTPPAEIIDPFGGEADLKKRVIRAVGEPEKRFSEDALRMMRAVRFASQLGFTIEEKTLKAIEKNAASINRIAKERVKEELFKILASPHPYEGFVLLKDSGLLAQILPELTRAFGVEQKSPQRHHIYDVGTHSFLSLKNCRSADPVVRFATLIHDIGKTETFKKLPTGVITFYSHEVVGAKKAKAIARRLRFSKDESEKLYKLVRWHQFTVNENQTDTAVRRFMRNVGPENVEDMLTLRVADRLGGGARETSWRLEEFKKRLLEVQREPFSLRDLKIDGKDVMTELDLKPSPEVGKLLNALFNEVVEKKLPNEKEALLKRLNHLHRQ